MRIIFHKSILLFQSVRKTDIVRIHSGYVFALCKGNRLIQRRGKAQIYLVGMHLKHVAVPVRLSEKMLGDAVVTAARTRAKFIGGSRAIYEYEKEVRECP